MMNDVLRSIHSVDHVSSSRIGRVDSTTFTCQDEVALLPELRGRVRGYVESTIRSMPREETDAYMQALKKCPEVVSTETDSLQFVRYCNYDVTMGAKRLCLYWTERRRLFGEKRAFLPLVLTGTGALSNDDVLTLHAGFPAILPKVRSGQNCVLFDRRKGIPGMSMENHLRCLFYVFSLLAQDDRSQVEGAMCFIVMMTARHPDLDWGWIDQAGRLLGTVFPVRLNLHLLNFPSQSRLTLAGLLNGTARAMLQSFGLAARVHIQERPGQIFDQLLSMGLATAGIPLYFGGEWKYEEFFKWCQSQCDGEKERCKGFLLEEETKTKERKRQLDDPGALTSAKAAKRRMADRLHSRRKRERKQKEENSLKEKYSSLLLQNRSLHAEHKRLENLVEQASAILASFPDRK